MFGVRRELLLSNNTVLRLNSESAAEQLAEPGGNEHSDRRRSGGQMTAFGKSGQTMPARQPIVINGEAEVFTDQNPLASPCFS
jgi:hypothetical protein